MGWFGKKQPSETDQGQDKRLDACVKSINSIVAWCNNTNKQIQALYQEIANLKGYDKQHDALFKSMQETDQKMQAVLDALGKATEKTES